MQDKNKKLKVVFISPYFYPVKGGVENNVFNMAQQTIKAGHEVTVITSDRKDGKGFERKNENYQGIEIIRLRRSLFPQYYLTWLPGLLRQLNKIKPDIVHTHIPGVIFTDFALIFRKLFFRNKSIYINTPHDPFMSRARYSTAEWIMRAIFNPILQIYYSWLYDYAIAVNPNQAVWIHGSYVMPESRIINVENAVEERLFIETPMDTQLKKQLEIEDQVVITSLARYHEYKGYQNILAAIKQIPNKRHLKFKFFGMGNDAGMLARLKNYVRNNKLEEYITLIENPSDNTRDQILEESQIFILASQVEAFGIAIVEAMAKGNAIISTNTEGGKYLINEERGLLYEHNDIDKLASHITRLVEDDELRKQMIKANKAFANNFHWENVFQNYKELLDQVSSHN